MSSGYRDLPFPFEEVPLSFLAMEAGWRLEELIGYITTWSAVKAAAAGTGSNPIAPLREGPRGVRGDPSRRLCVRWPLAVRVGRLCSDSGTGKPR
jgi:hypothetical protein